MFREFSVFEPYLEHLLKQHVFQLHKPISPYETGLLRGILDKEIIAAEKYAADQGWDTLSIHARVGEWENNLIMDGHFLDGNSY